MTEGGRSCDGSETCHPTSWCGAVGYGYPDPWSPSHLQKTAIDIGLSGNDICFGNGRIDALRAVNGDTSKSYDDSAPFCPEYDE